MSEELIPRRFMDGDDWGLGAVVSGYSSHAAAQAPRDPFSSFPPAMSRDEPVEEGEDLILERFPDLMVARTARHELEELCRPFICKSEQHQTSHQQQQRKQQYSEQIISPRRSIPSSSAAASHLSQHPRQPPRSKRRKNQQKKVVLQVPADGASSDMWAWRKYGQKPIKGSPYPRGYYRCSSSKGCLARKQVERSRADPTMLVISYTAEHNHPLPTHRNSLAGSTRQKFQPSMSFSPTSAAPPPPLPSNQFSSPPSPSTTAGLGFSPSTPPAGSMEEGDVDEEETEETAGGDELLLMDFEELAIPREVAAPASPAAGVFFNGDGGLGDRFFAPPWLAASNAAAAAGGD